MHGKGVGWRLVRALLAYKISGENGGTMCAGVVGVSSKGRLRRSGV